jgi:hypothetical protein
MLCLGRSGPMQDGLSGRAPEACVNRAEGLSGAIDFSALEIHMRLACKQRTRRIRNDNFSPITYRD